MYTFYKKKNRMAVVVVEERFWPKVMGNHGCKYLRLHECSALKCILLPGSCTVSVSAT